MSHNPARIPSRLHQFLWHPISAFVAAATLLATGLVVSYFLGQLSAGGLVAAAVVLLLSVCAGVAAAFVLFKHLLAPEIARERQGHLDDAQSLKQDVEQSLARFDQRLGLFLRSSLPQADTDLVMTDSQYAMLEMEERVARVVIVVRDLANEFEEDLDDRTALVDFGSIVLENIGRGVEYIYVTQEMPRNRLRARRVATKAGDRHEMIRVSFVTLEDWKDLPFQAQTVFLRDTTGGEEGYFLLPDGKGKADRHWIRISHDFRDDWLSALEAKIAAASPIRP